MEFHKIRSSDTICGICDDLVRLDMPTGVKIIAFADDEALFSSAIAPVILEETLGEDYRQVRTWMGNHGLGLVAEKNVSNCYH